MSDLNHVRKGSTWGYAGDLDEERPVSEWLEILPWLRANIGTNRRVSLRYIFEHLGGPK